MNFEKMGWATFWATFSQTRLVTLLATRACTFPEWNRNV
jgi:hypothetical protein